MTPTEANDKLIRAIMRDDVRAAQAALDAGADPKARDELTQTPLHCAANNSRTEIARLLIRYGADVNAKTDDGETPLHFAAFQKSSANFVHALIEAGADPTVSNKWRKIPADTAARLGHTDIALLLLDRMSALTAKDGQQKTPVEVAASLGYPGLVQTLQDAARDKGHAARIVKRRGDDEPQRGG